ncbi:MAG: hypothetical protein OXU81_07915 [Gammaproteobacteria bacterium]|nr:hypothetical protein [Gammaproteobacteria bacterium]
MAEVVFCVTAMRTKLFPELSKNCWLLHADGFGGSTTELCFSVLDHFKAYRAAASYLGSLRFGDIASICRVVRFQRLPAFF